MVACMHVHNERGEASKVTDAQEYAGHHTLSSVGYTLAAWDLEVWTMQGEKQGLDGHLDGPRINSCR